MFVITKLVDGPYGIERTVRFSSSSDVLEEDLTGYQVDVYSAPFPKVPILPTIQAVKSTFQECQMCNLSLWRRNTVHHFCTGTSPEVVLIGQCPGSDEDERGLPFVGQSGKVLQMILGDAQFYRPYAINNLVSCRPHAGRTYRDDPKSEELIACAGRLWAFLLALSPKAIIALGKIPASMFWDKPDDYEINTFYRQGSVTIARTWHPSFISRVMGEGSMWEYQEAVTFFERLSKLPLRGPFDFWQEGKYPFAYLRKRKDI